MTESGQPGPVPAVSHMRVGISGSEEPQRYAISRSAPIAACQAVGMQHRQLGQQLGVQPVGFGVLDVVAAQIRRALRWH